jgi:hypothetical protein
MPSLKSGENARRSTVKALLLRKHSISKRKGRELRFTFHMSFGQTWRIAVWIMCLLGTAELRTSAESLEYKTEKYGESAGLYYEQLRETTLYNTEWKTVNIRQPGTN